MTHEEGMGQHTCDAQAAASLCSSELHMAAHTTRTAHPVKGVEMDIRIDEDDGRRKRTKRGSDIDAMTPSVARPSTSMSVEPSGAASGSHRSREIIGILAEAKSRIIQKEDFNDFGNEKKRERDPG